MVFAADAQRRSRAAARRPSRNPPAVPPRVEPAKVTFPRASAPASGPAHEYCSVLDGRDSSQGVLAAIPPHTGERRLRFALHNRHTYSEEQMKAGRGFARYTAVIGALSLKGDLIDRAAVQTEFRAPRLLRADLRRRRPGGVRPSRRSGTSRSASRFRRRRSGEPARRSAGRHHAGRESARESAGDGKATPGRRRRQHVTVRSRQFRATLAETETFARQAFRPIAGERAAVRVRLSVRLCSRKLRPSGW